MVEKQSLDEMWENLEKGARSRVTGKRRRGMTEEGRRRQPLGVWAEDAFEM